MIRIKIELVPHGNEARDHSNINLITINATHIIKKNYTAKLLKVLNESK